MGSQSVTCGSTVQGLVPGLRDSLGQGMGISIIGIIGNPSGVVTAPSHEGVDNIGISGTTIAYDATNNKIFMHVSGTYGNLWNELGSIAFT